MLDDDRLPLDEVGPWAKEKRDRLCKYVDISHAVRRKFIRGGGGATYIDPYCGTGRAVIRETGEKIDGSPLVAFKSAQACGVPFSEVHIADVAEPSVRAAERRISVAGGSPQVEIGSASDAVIAIAKKLSPHGLHFAFLDPYNLQDLPFSVIETLCAFKHMDILIHVSAQDLQRNLDAYSSTDESPLDRFAPGWRSAVNLRQSQRAIRAAIMSFWAAKCQQLGFPPAEHAELVTGPIRNQRLYWLVFVARHSLAKSFWDKIRSPSGQRDLFG